MADDPMGSEVNRIAPRVVSIAMIARLMATRPFETAALSGVCVGTDDGQAGKDNAMKGISHVAIGVREMDRSLPFYRDLLGLKVMLDTVEDLGKGRDGRPRRRRAVYMRWGDGSHAPFLVLSQSLEREPSGIPLRLDQVGIHHFSFWVADLRTRAEKLTQTGVKFLIPPYEADTVAYGEGRGGKVLTCLFEDPDGTILQFDQRMG
ncbi:MAG: VOC family protein [Candidatus Binataceae bacterium]